MKRRGLVMAAALCAVVAVALGVTSEDGAQLARAQSPTAPTVTLNVPLDDACQCVRDTVQLTATVTPSAGRTITRVEYAWSPAGANDWRLLQPASTSPYTSLWSTTFPDRLFGLFDVRAIATDSANEQTTVVARDRPVANGGGNVALEDTGPVLAGRTTLRALYTLGQPSGEPTHALFQISPSGAETWTDVGLDAEAAFVGNTVIFSVELNATDLPAGRYDLRALPTNEFDPAAEYVSSPLRDRLLDKEGPRATLEVPPAPLEGVVRLTASAHDASGIAAVRFERSPAGANSWSAITTRAHEPYAVDFDTRGLEDGVYDFRVVATDKGGNSASSPVVEDVEVRNPGRVTLGDPAVTSVVAPAGNLTLLGTTRTGETWAWGTASGPPPLVDRQPLTYTARGSQLVLLRYTEASGWQVRDVLRDEDGAPFALRDITPTDIQGQMTPSGEAWIAVRQTGGPAGIEGVLFHRSPGRFGGQFRADPEASARLAPLLTAATTSEPKRLQVGEDGSDRVFAVLVAPGQNAPALPETGAGGGLINVREALEYGLLDGQDWQLKTLPRPSGYTARDGDTIRLKAVDITGPGTGWVAVGVSGSANLPPRIGRLGEAPWDPITTGLEVLDGTDAFAQNPPELVTTGLRATGDGVWIGVETTLARRRVVAYYDEAAREATRSWCEPLGRPSVGCGSPLDEQHPAMVPDQVLASAQGQVAVAVRDSFIHTYANGEWTRGAAPGFEDGGPGRLLFTGPEEGWVAGAVAFGRVTPEAPRAPMATWPQSNRSTLLSVALPPGSGGTIGESGALAVGLDGVALGYDAAAGWQVQDTPSRASRQALRAVAFAGPSQAFAVGGAGIILRWDGASWAEDPQSAEIANSELQALAFDREGRGWAVGRFATILHFDGSTWSEERPPQEDADAGATISSVTVAGDEVFAVSDGNLIQRGAGGQWRRVDRSELPDGEGAAPLPFENDLRVVSGLPDGGIVAAGRSVVLTRQHPGARFEYAEQPIEGVVFALSAFRDSDGSVRAFASSAAAIPVGGIVPGGDIGGFPAGDGVLLRQTAGGWVDLSNSQPPLKIGDLAALIGDGIVKPDPVLAVATSPGGARAWAVGGYAGTRTAAGQGIDDVLPARPMGWRTAHLWRYDAGGPAQSSADVPVAVTPEPAPANVRFAYFSNPQCREQCVKTQNAQPDVNLTSALRQIDEYSRQPGGPAFAVLGGNARGPVQTSDWQAGKGEADFRRLPTLLGAAGRVPLFAVLGTRDPVPTREDRLRPWADAFARSPAPFGPRPAPGGISPVATGASVGAVHRYYAFDAEQNGATLRGLVLDNSNPDQTAPPLDREQTLWLKEQLTAAQDANRATVVFLSQPLATASNSEHLALAFRFVELGVLAVFVPGETNDYRLFPSEGGSEFRIPLITGGSLGYQQTRNNGVSWFSVSVDVAKRTVDAEARPVLESLALKPLLGLTVARSQTLAFEAVGRRPLGTLATTPSNPAFPGFDSYVTIPAPPCQVLVCISPGYRFESSDPTIGDFVLPRGPGSRFPALDRDGRPMPARSSSLFCAYNSGTTTVSITVGTRRASLPVTVLAGGFGRPCGTVFREGVRPIVFVPRPTAPTTVAPPGGAPAPPASPPPGGNQPPTPLPNIPIPFPAPPPPPPPPPEQASPPPDRPSPAEPRQPPVPEVRQPPPPPPQTIPNPVPVVLPLIPPNIQPIPPGGAASAQAAARRKEKVRQHASQSAFTTHVPGETWFYGAVGAMTLLTLLLIAGGVRPDPRRRPAPALLRIDPPGRGGRS